jgi:tetratricopeptide (TPR) repeat protein
LLAAYVEGMDLLERAAEIAASEEGAPPCPAPLPADAYRARARELIAASREAEHFTPDTASQMSWILLSHTEKDLRDVPRALRLVEHAVEQIPTRSDFQWTLAAARYYVGQYGEAEEALAKSVELDRHDAWSWPLSALIQSGRGNEKAARDNYGRAEAWLAQHPPDDDLRRFRAEVTESLQHVLNPATTAEEVPTSGDAEPSQD